VSTAAAPRPVPAARTGGVRPLSAACQPGEDKLYGHIKPRKTRTRFLEFCRYLRSLYPASTRIAITCDNFSPHLTTRRDARVGTWAAANNVEIAYTPTNSCKCARTARRPCRRAVQLRWRQAGLSSSGQAEGG
jgi:hypothetical protein